MSVSFGGWLLPRAAAQERSQGRSMVLTTGGIAASSQTLASAAGAQVLARGGSVVDAAIAVNAVLSVVEPMMCGLGGDLFAIHYDAKTQKLTGLNGSGWAPRRMTAAPAGGFTGINSVTVPGAVDGWAKMHARFGKRPWAELFQPAIHFAEAGFPVTEIIHEDWATSNGKWTGRVPEVGEIWKSPGLGRAYRILAAEGRDGFYKGPIAAAILRTSGRLGGMLEAADFAEFESQFVEPISTTYRGARVWELPPNGQGLSALEMLNLMERFPAAELTLHRKIEAQKLSVQDLLRYVADPRQAEVPVDALLSKDYAAARAATIDPRRAHCDVAAGDPARPKNTVYLTVIDREGNMVSWIQSIFNKFGSGIYVDDYGFPLHDRAGLFSTVAGHPNAVAPHKRPLHTIIPGFLEYKDQRIAFGIMGGFNQAQAHAQFVARIVDEGMNIQAAMEAPRFTRRDPGGCKVYLENRFPAAEIDRLRRMGHDVEVRGAFSAYMGGGQAVALDRKTGVHSGASDPRKDGAAVPEPADLSKLLQP